MTLGSDLTQVLELCFVLFFFLAAVIVKNFEL